MSKKITTTLFLLVCLFVNAQQISTVTGFNGFGYLDGSLSTAKFHGPRGLCFNPTGTAFYLADSQNNKIRKIDLLTGIVTTIAGSTEGYADGIGTTASFFNPTGVCLDSNGYLYVSDALNHKIRKIDLSNNMVTTFAGSTQGYANGLGTNAKFNEPNGICIDSNNNIYISENQGHKVRKITPSGYVSNLAGSNAGYADGVGTNAMFFGPAGLCIDEQNNIYVAEFYSKIRKITPDGTVTTVAGSNTSGYLDGTALQAKFLTLSGISIDNANNIYVVDNNTKIRKLDLVNNIVSTIMDSCATDGDPYGAPEDLYAINNTIYLVDFSYNKIKKITDLLSNEKFNTNNYFLSPNPNTGSFSIKNIELVSIEIYDILGQMVFTQKEINSMTQIETNLKKGIYLVTLINEKGKLTTQKMVVE